MSIYQPILVKITMLLWALLALSYFIYWFIFRKARLRLPTAKGLPIFGSVFQIDPKRSHVTITEWAHKYGSVFVVNMFRDQVVFVNDYETIYDVLVKRGDEFSDRPNFFRVKLCSRGFKGIVSPSASSTEWQVLRKAAHKYVKFQDTSGAEKLEKLLADAVNYQIEAIESYQGKPFNVRKQFYYFGESIIYMLLFGERLDPGGEEAKKIREMVEAFISNSSIVGSGVLLDVFPWLSMFPNKAYSNIMKANRAIDIFWKKHKLKLESDDQSASLVKHMLNLKKTLKSDQGENILNETDIEFAMFDLLSAGSTTTVASVSAFILILLHFPDVQRKIQTEIDDIIGRYNIVTLAVRDDMPYTRAAIYELLRYVSVTPFLPHAASTDTQINGEYIPKGTKVVINLWCLHHDEAFWEDPWNFRPERFLDANGGLIPADHPNRKRLLPFGAGPRVCIGEIFALKRLFLLITSLLQKFEICADITKELPSCDPRNYVTGLVVHPKDFTVSMVTRDI